MKRKKSKQKDYFSNVQNKYSIRKFSVGITSILIGASVIFGANSEAHAAEIKSDDNTQKVVNKEYSDGISQEQQDKSLNLAQDKEKSNNVNKNKVTDVGTSDVLKDTKTTHENVQQQDNVASKEETTKKTPSAIDKNNTSAQSEVVTSSDATKTSTALNQVDRNQLSSQSTSERPKKRVKRDVGTDDKQLVGEFVFSGTNSNERRYNLTSDIVSNRRVTSTSFSYSASGHGTIDNGKLVYEAPKKFIISEPTFSKSEFVTNKTNLSDNETWRYQFDLRPLSGTSAGQINISQVIGGMIWTGPGEGDVVTSTMKMYQGDTLVDTKQVNATFDHIKGGLYIDRGQEKPTSIWRITRKSAAAQSPTIGVIKEDGTISEKTDNYRYQVPLPRDNWFLENRDDAVSPHYYSRYTDFKYNILNIPSWLELDPDAKGNRFWTQDESGIHLHLNEGDILPYNGYTPVLKLKKSALTPELLAKFKTDGFIKVNLDWQTIGRLPNGQDYIQNVPDPEGIKFKMINEAGTATSNVYFMNFRLQEPSHLFSKADHKNEVFRVQKYIYDRDQSNKYAPTYMHSIQLPSGQEGDYFTTFKLSLPRINYNNGSSDKNADKGIVLKAPFILYGVNADGSTTKLNEWTSINNTNNTYGLGDKKYNHLILQTPIIRDTVSPDSEAEKDIYGWEADITYAVDDQRWETAAKDDDVTQMQNGIIINQVAENTLQAASSVPTRALTGNELQPAYSYIHTKDAFKHTLTDVDVRNTNSGLGNVLNYNEKANVIVKADTKDYMKYLSTDPLDNSSDISVDKLDHINHVYLSLSAPDDTAIGNVRAWTNNELIRTSTVWNPSLYETTPSNVLKNRPVLNPIKVIKNYKNSGRTLYIYEAPEGYKWNQSVKNSITERSSITQNTPEITFDIYNRGTLPTGTYSIRYATIWDENSEIVRPTEEQSLSHNNLELSDVITEDLSGNKKFVSVIDVPFKIALAKEYASTLTIGKDASNSFDKSQVDVNLGESVNLQTNTANFTNSEGIIKEIIVTIPKDNIKTNLTALIPDTEKYRVVYTTDTDVRNGVYNSNPTDLTKVTAVKYVFDEPLVLTNGQSFQTNMRVTVPEDAPILTKAHSQIFTKGLDNTWLSGNKVELETEDNRGDLVVKYTNESGNTIQNSLTSKGKKNTEYNVSVPQMIDRLNRHYKFVRVDNQLDPTTGHYAKGQTKIVNLIYVEVFEGSVIADYKTTDGEVLSPLVTVVNSQIEGTEYTATPATIPDRVTFETTDDGKVKKTISYHLISTPENQSGTVVGKQTIEVHYVYEPITTYEQIPNDAPQETPVALEVTRYVDSEGNEVQETEEGTHDAPGIIADKWQYTGQTAAENGITTHVYERIQSEIPNEAPQETPVALEVTRYVDSEGNEVQETEEGTHDAPGIIGDKWQYTGQTTAENGITTHIYQRIQSEIPNEAPQETPVELEVTRYVDGEGNEVQETEEGTHDAPGIIGDKWQYTGQTTTESGITTHVYERIQSEIPNEAPQETPVALEVTRYVDSDGNEVQETEEGTHQPPGIIGDKWQYTGQTTTTDGITTYVYERIQSEIPNEAPKETPIQLEVTRYVDSDGNEVQETEEGTHQPPSIIGDKWQYTGQTTTADGITTYVYERIQSEIPNEAPKETPVQLEVTRYVDTDGNEVQETEEGTHQPPGIIGDKWQYTGQTTTADGITTYVYERIQSAIPNDAPQETPVQLEITRYVDGKGNEVQETTEGKHEPPGIIGDRWQYTGQTTTADGITTYVYERIQSEIPNEAPQETPVQLEVTRYVDITGNEVQETEEGTHQPRYIIGDKWRYSGVTVTENGITKHVYERIQSEIPNNPPQETPVQLEVTRYVDPEGNEIQETTEGKHQPPGIIGDRWQYTGKVTEKDGIITYVYERIQSEIPNNPPQETPVQLEVTRYVDPEGNEVQETTEGKHQPPSIIGDRWQYTGKVTEKDGITTYVYERIQSKVPNDAPRVDIDELKITIYVDTNGREIVPSRKGQLPPEQFIGQDWQYTGHKIEKDGITTYIYKKVENAVPAKQLKKTKHNTQSESQFKHTPQVKQQFVKYHNVKEQRSIEKSEHTDMHVSELPETGETANKNGLIGGLLIAIGAFFVTKRKKENTK